jgi:hypothetical protein
LNGGKQKWVDREGVEEKETKNDLVLELFEFAVL